MTSSGWGAPSSLQTYVNDVSVFLRSVPGEMILFDPNRIHQRGEFVNTQAEKFITKGKATLSVLLPVVPSIPFTYDFTDDNSEIPEEILRKPLVKVPEEENEQKAFQSGGRSAILYSSDTGKLYRLKGKIHCPSK